MILPSDYNNPAKCYDKSDMVLVEGLKKLTVDRFSLMVFVVPSLLSVKDGKMNVKMNVKMKGEG